jgi:hypothetical protein
MESQHRFKITGKCENGKIIKFEITIYNHDYRKAVEQVSNIVESMMPSGKYLDLCVKDDEDIIIYSTDF